MQKEVKKMDIEAVLMKYEEKLMQFPNVTIVGIGKKAGKSVIKVFVVHKVPESTLRPQDIIPKSLEGYEVDVEESGTISIESQDKEERRR
jgi:hypothetical protein